MNVFFILVCRCPENPSPPTALPQSSTLWGSGRSPDLWFPGFLGSLGDHVKAQGEGSTSLLDEWLLGMVSHLHVPHVPIKGRGHLHTWSLGCPGTCADLWLLTQLLWRSCLRSCPGSAAPHPSPPRAGSPGLPQRGLQRPSRP